MQKTAYELRISDWRSDVCSSDLQALQVHLDTALCRVPDRAVDKAVQVEVAPEFAVDAAEQVFVERRRHAQGVVVGGDHDRRNLQERKSVVEGKSVSVRVGLGGRRIIKKKKGQTTHTTGE